MNRIWNEKQTLRNVGTYETTLRINSNIGLHCETFSAKQVANPGAPKRYILCFMFC